MIFNRVFLLLLSCVVMTQTAKKDIASTAQAQFALRLADYQNHTAQLHGDYAYWHRKWQKTGNSVALSNMEQVKLEIQQAHHQFALGMQEQIDQIANKYKA